jgi:hypothetical protein
MMVHMRHMGNSGKFAVITGMVAAGLLILTGMTLAEPVFVAFLGVLALAYVACIVEVLRRRRYLMLAIAGLSTSLAIAGSLAFLSTWELAFTDESSLFGTPLPTDDPDNYFFLAALSLLTALGSLFLGAAWPGRRRPIVAGCSWAGCSWAGCSSSGLLPERKRCAWTGARAPPGRGGNFAAAHLLGRTRAGAAADVVRPAGAPNTKCRPAESPAAERGRAKCAASSPQEIASGPEEVASGAEEVPALVRPRHLEFCDPRVLSVQFRPRFLGFEDGEGAGGVSRGGVHVGVVVGVA